MAAVELQAVDEMTKSLRMIAKPLIHPSLVINRLQSGIGYVSKLELKVDWVHDAKITGRVYAIFRNT